MAARATAQRWTLVLGMLAALAIGAAFLLVVQRAVLQGDARRASQARQADSDWRCRLLAGAGQRADCIARAADARADAAGAEALPASPPSGTVSTTAAER